jgi:NADH dehydrogenase
VLLEIGPRILPELGSRHPRLVSYAEKRVMRLGLEVHLNTGLKSATAEEAVLSSGERLTTRTIITCTGMKASPLLDQFPYERDPRGRIVTDQYCRVPGTMNIWAGGDCAATPHPDGGSCPPLAHYAQKSGSTIGKNILIAAAGKLLKPYSFNGLGEACTLGHRCAIAQMKGVRAYGWFAWIGWRLIVLTMFVPSWTRRVRLVFDWLLTLILGRDIVNPVNPKMNERADIFHALYEPGQVIASAGETRCYHYLVERGEVDIVEDNKNCEVILSTLRTGDYFSHLSNPGQVYMRARTRVHLLGIDRYAADALSAIRPDLAVLLKQNANTPVRCG